MAEEMHAEKILQDFLLLWTKQTKKRTSEGNNQENNWGNLIRYSYVLNILRSPKSARTQNKKFKYILYRITGNSVHAIAWYFLKRVTETARFLQKVSITCLFLGAPSLTTTQSQAAFSKAAYGPGNLFAPWPATLLGCFQPLWKQ